MHQHAGLGRLLFVLLLLHLTTPGVRADDTAAEPIVFYDLTPVFSANLEVRRSGGGSGMRPTWWWRCRGWSIGRRRDCISATSRRPTISGGNR